MQDPVVERFETCSLAVCRRIAVMLDFDPAHVLDGDPLPRGWHFPLLAGETPRSQLRTDGFPGLGIVMPQLDLPRLVLSRRTVEFLGEISIGDTLKRRSSIERMTRKGTDDDPVVVVDIDHRLSSIDTGEVLVHETQSYALLPPRSTSVADRGLAARRGVGGGTVITPDDTLLFQYSALCFNSHRIHLDRGYAREVEGYPDLVVNGGLTTLLATERLRTEWKVLPARLQLRYVAPLFCGNPMTIELDRSTAPYRLAVRDQIGAEAVVGAVEPDGSAT
jgi:3-methylfumaryl-CoA hydratase